VLDGLTYAGDPARLYESAKFDRARVRILWHDLNAPIMDTLIRRIGGVDAVVNMASNSHIDKSIADPVPFVKNNVNIALHMLEYARAVSPDVFVKWELMRSTDPSNRTACHIRSGRRSIRAIHTARRKPRWSPS